MPSSVQAAAAAVGQGGEQAEPSPSRGDVEAGAGPAAAAPPTCGAYAATAPPARGAYAGAGADVEEGAATEPPLPRARGPAPWSRWRTLQEAAASAWVQLSYFFSVNFCAAEDLPLIEATEFFFGCLPHGDELTTQQRLAIMADLRASVHAAVADHYARQQEQRRRRNRRALRSLVPAYGGPALGGARAGGGAGGGGEWGPDCDSGDDEAVAAARTASKAMASYREQWERLQRRQREREEQARASAAAVAAAPPFGERAGPGWREWREPQWGAWQEQEQSRQLQRRAAARGGQGAGGGEAGSSPQQPAGALLPLLQEDRAEAHGAAPNGTATNGAAAISGGGPQGADAQAGQAPHAEGAGGRGEARSA